MAEIIDFFWVKSDRRIAAIEREQQELLRQVIEACERSDRLPGPETFASLRPDDYSLHCDLRARPTFESEVVEAPPGSLQAGALSRSVGESRPWLQRTNLWRR